MSRLPELLKPVAVVLLSLALGVAGRPALAEDAGDAEAALRARVEAYWTARAAGQVEEAVAYYVPLAGGQAPVDVPENGGLWFKDFEIVGVDVQGDRADVRVRVTTPDVLAPVHMTKLPESLRRPVLPEEWVLLDGTWRKVVPDRSLSRIGRRNPNPRAGDAVMSSQPNAASGANEGGPEQPTGSGDPESEE